MSTEPPKGRVYEQTGAGVTSPHASGRLRHWVERVRKRRGRPPDERVAGWAARIEGPGFQEFDSLRAKCRELMWVEYLESGGDPDALTEDDLVKRAEACRVALMRWYKKHP